MSKGVFVTNEQVRLTGSANVARFLAQCLYWSKNDLVIQRQGWFYKSRDEWQAETWLSRYQQEKARKKLRNMGVLRERRERRNTGIRLWFWVDQVLLNLLLNSLADQSINKDAKTENNPTELYDSSLTNESDNLLTGQLDNYKEVEESKCIKDNETKVLKTPLINSINGKNGTLVSINNNDVLLINSDNYCIDNEESDTEAGIDKEAAIAPSLLQCEYDLSIENEAFDNNEPLVQPEHNNDIQHCDDPEAYKACHPFIYQFLKTRVFTGYDWSAVALNLFRCDGLNDAVIQDALRVFINNQGPGILAWYQANTPIPVKPLSQDDLSLAVLISEGALQ